MKNITKGKILRRARKTFVRQYSGSYCGLACLASVTRFFGGNTTQEKLLEVSGTNINGTSLLGLYHAANYLGFEATAFQGTIDALKKTDAPVILHVTMPDNVQHYVISYGFFDGKFLIGDPGFGISEYTGKALNEIWTSKALLRLIPGKMFRYDKSERQKKRQWFIQLIRDDLTVLFVAVIIGIFISVLSLSTAIFSQKLLDQILPEKNINQLVTGLLLLMLLLLAKAYLTYIRSVFLIRQSKLLNIRIVSEFFNKLLYLPMRFFASTSNGDMVARLNDTQRIQKVVVNLSGQIIIDLLLVLVSISYVLLNSVTTGIIMLASIPVYVFIFSIYNPKIIKEQTEVMQSYALTESKYLETLAGISVIKSFNHESFFGNKVQLTFGNFMNKVYDLGIRGTSLTLQTQLAGTILLISVISHSSYLVITNMLSVGELMAVLTVIATYMGSVHNIALAFMQFHEAKTAFERMYEFTSAKAEFEIPKGIGTQQTQHNGPDNLTVEDLNFRYPGSRLLLKNISMEVRRGEMVAIYGAIGSGKSTIINILQRFHEFESGTIRINGSNWDEITIPEWRSLTGYVSQSVELFRTSVLNNISMGEDSDAEKVVSFCKVNGLHKYFMGFPQGYFTVVNENGSNLSGGQKQLVGIARALYKQPKILLLDEATSAMDLLTEKFVFNLMKRLKTEMSIVYVTHKPQLAEIADRIYTLDNNTLSRVHLTNETCTVK